MGPPDGAGPRWRRRGRAGRRRLAGQEDFDGPRIVAQGREGLERDSPAAPRSPPAVNRVGEGNLAGHDLAPDPLAQARPREQAECHRERRGGDDDSQELIA